MAKRGDLSDPISRRTLEDLSPGFFPPALANVFFPLAFRHSRPPSAAMDFANYASQPSQDYSLYGLPTPDHQPQSNGDDALRDPFTLVWCFPHVVPYDRSLSKSHVSHGESRIPIISTFPAWTPRSVLTPPHPLCRRHLIRRRTPLASTRFPVMR